jgi:hypothetical protein
VGVRGWEVRAERKDGLAWKKGMVDWGNLVESWRTYFRMA